MTNTQHTPGPWKIVTATVGINETIFHDPPQIVCEQGSFIADADRRNARLIASAPDLLDALEELVTAVESFTLSRFEMDGIDTMICKTVSSRAAIAKATGQ